jgi:Ferric uptake regulator family
VGNARRAATPKAEVVARGLERFRAVLRERSLKMSKVRESIARAALMFDGHFSVDELVQTLHERGVRDAHLATVYRAVPLLVEAGLIQPALVSKSDGQRYEASFEREHHAGGSWSTSPRRSRRCSARSLGATSSSSTSTCTSSAAVARAAAVATTDHGRWLAQSSPVTLT